MLVSLRVKNLALVEDIAVEFGPGLNVVTGETGTGKSILIGALGLLLGERADKSLVRAGADQCSAEAVFKLSDPDPANEALEALGLDPLTDDLLIVRRTVKAEGGGVSLLNDRPVTVQALKRIGERLVDMHGPYDHQSLLRIDTQRDILDAFGHLHKVRHEYELRYEALSALAHRRDALSAVGEDLSEQIELLSYKVKELEEAELTVEEEEQVLEEHSVFGHAQRIVELANLAAGALTEGEGAAHDVVASILRPLDELAGLLPEAETWREEADAVTRQIRELSAAIALRMDGMDVDPSRLAWLDDRLTTYQKMKKKYGPTVSDALASLEKARTRLNELESRDEQLAELTREYERVRAELVAIGKKLHTERVQVANGLAAAITEELRALGFAHGCFGVAVEEGEPNPSGLDSIEFGFEPNLGEGMRPLRQIASSGEISRVMLATKAVLARHDRIPVLVFDEIDANIGGETGGAVGRKLHEVAGHHQILCITHLPQVAMYGRRHYAVRKETEQGRTHTDVVALEGEARVEEIARMLGGRDLTEVTLRHAKEMLKKAQGSRHL